MIYLDLDDTLFRTRHLQDYRKTQEGRTFLSQNAHKFQTPLIHSALEEVLAEYEQTITILTDSPEEYARAILAKFGYDFPIIGSAGKPFVQPLQRNSLIIGDHAKDALTGHQQKLPTISVTWGYSTAEQLNQAQPSAICTNPCDLMELIAEWEQNEIGYADYTNNTPQLPISEWTSAQPEIKTITLGDYVPVRNGKDQHSKNILRYKDSKQYTREQINKGKTDDFYWNGQLRTGGRYLDTIIGFINQLKTRTSKLEESTILASPNSLPEYAYKLDVNQITTENTARGTKHKSLERTLKRVKPKQESNRRLSAHYQTLGMTPAEINTPNVIIFDDVITSGAQIEALARLLRWQGYNGKIYALALGKTQQALNTPF